VAAQSNLCVNWYLLIFKEGNFKQPVVCLGSSWVAATILCPQQLFLIGLHSEGVLSNHYYESSRVGW
jgi:hypothetical protein